MFKNLAAGQFYQVFKKYKRDGQVLCTLVIKQELWIWKSKRFFFNVFPFFGDKAGPELAIASWRLRNINLSLAIVLAAYSLRKNNESTREMKLKYATNLVSYASFL